VDVMGLAGRGGEAAVPAHALGEEEAVTDILVGA
jgi:hypothetical protein